MHHLIDKVKFLAFWWLQAKLRN